MKTFKADFLKMLKIVGISIVLFAIFLNMTQILNNRSDIQKLQSQVFKLSLIKAEKGETDGRQNWSNLLSDVRSRKQTW